MIRIIQKALHAMQRRLLWLLCGAYVLAALLPGPGSRVRSLSAGSVPWLHGSTVQLSLPTLMLAFLLLNAGLCADARELRHVRRVWLIGAGLAANTLLPLLFALAVSLSVASWRDSEEPQSILVGLALIASMPIAGSSPAWAQNAGGNVALSLALVWASTLASPVLSPLGLQLIGYMAQGDYAEDLHDLALHGASGFLVFAVVIPSVLGVLLRELLSPEQRATMLPALKLLNLVNLLALNYSNASSALPQVLHHAGWPFVLVTILITTSLCLLAFGCGGLVARCAGADAADRLAMMFGLGMNNNGTGLVLASMELPDHPLVMVPIILYNLAQQVIAGVVDARHRRRG